MAGFQENFSPQGPGGTPEAAFQRGLAHQEAGQWEAAVSAYRQAVALKPDFAGAYCNLGIVLKRQGRANEAIEAYQKAIAAEPRFTEALYNMGILLDLVGRHQEAAEAYRRALALQPGFAAAHCNLGKALQEQGDLEGASACYRETLNLQPNHLNALLNLSFVLFARDRPDEALAVARQAQTLAPDRLEVLERLVKAQLACQQAEAGLRNADRALALFPDEPGALELKIAALGALARPADIEAAYRGFIAAHPAAELPYARLADVYLKENNGAAALGVAEEALARIPGNTRALAAKGAALLSLGRHKDLAAHHDLDRLVRLSPCEAAPGFADMAAFHRALADHILQHPTLESDPLGLATRAGRHTGELLIEPKGPIGALEQMIVAAVQDYARTFPADPTHPFLGQAPARWSLTIWAVVLGSEGYQVPHLHPSGWLSGVYYVAVPPGLAASSNSHEGWIEFGRPPQLAPDEACPDLRLIRPEPGLMVLFPSYLYHRTVPTGQADLRISIAFDVLPHDSSPARAGGG